MECKSLERHGGYNAKNGAPVVRAVPRCGSHPGNGQECQDMIRRNIMSMRRAASDGKDICKIEVCRGCDEQGVVHKVETAYASMSSIEEYVDRMQQQQEGGTA